MAFARSLATAVTSPIYPVPIELICALYRADDDKFGRLIAVMPEAVRTTLASYCAEQKRLRPLSIKMARTCEEAGLVHLAGFAGSATLIGILGADRFAFHPDEDQIPVLEFDQPESDRLDLCEQAYTAQPIPSETDFSLTTDDVVLVGAKLADFQADEAAYLV